MPERNHKTGEMISNYSGRYPEAGCDEAGRGCLAGPVVSAAVILPPDYNHKMLKDSKLLTPKNRDIVRKSIIENAVDYAVEIVDNQTVDEINILNAAILGMHKALSKLKTKPQFIIVDGNRFKPFENIEYQTIIKGDSKYKSIAAASILAKTTRDNFMETIAKEYPLFEWDKNKGYPTKAHRNAISKHGITPYHRMSFKLIDNQTKIEF